MSRSECTSWHLMMVPPPGFLERAVVRGLAQVLAEEQLTPMDPWPPHNDTVPLPPPSRRRHDSGVINLSKHPR